jgi:hypothetical protein
VGLIDLTNYDHGDLYEVAKDIRPIGRRYIQPCSCGDDREEGKDYCTACEWVAYGTRPARKSAEEINES